MISLISIDNGVLRRGTCFAWVRLAAGLPDEPLGAGLRGAGFLDAEFLDAEFLDAEFLGAEFLDADDFGDEDFTEFRDGELRWAEGLVEEDPATRQP